MRHHPENVGVAILAEDFLGAFVRFRRVAIIDAGHDSPWFFRFLFVLPNGRMPFDSIRRLTQQQHRRVKMPPQYCSTLARSIFAEWGLVKANTRRGVFRVNNLIVNASRATMSHAQV